jgi:hypothetical protein
MCRRHGSNRCRRSRRNGCDIPRVSSVRTGPNECHRRKPASLIPKVEEERNCCVDDRSDRIIEGILADVPLIHPGDLSTIRAVDRARGLTRTEVATIAETGQQVALARLGDLGLKARQRAEEPRPMKYILCVYLRRRESESLPFLLELSLRATLNVMAYSWKPTWPAPVHRSQYAGHHSLEKTDPSPRQCL